MEKKAIDIMWDVVIVVLGLIFLLAPFGFVALLWAIGKQFS